MEEKDLNESICVTEHDPGIEVTDVSGKEHTRNASNLTIDFSLMSQKTIEYLKEIQAELKEEEKRSNKNYYNAGHKENLMNKFLSSKSNLVMAMSGIALVFSAISFVNSTKGASRAFVETEENLTKTSITSDGSITGSAIPEELKEQFDELERKGTVLLSKDGNPELEQKINELIDARLSKINGISGKFSLNTDEEKAEFAHAVQEAMNYLRAEENRKAISQIEEKFSAAENTTPNNRKLYGNPNARFVIKEYSDLECPFCKNFFDTPKAVADASKGQVAVEWIHTPLSFHEPAATQEAIATECVFEQKGNKGFWTSLQFLFDTTVGNGKGSGAMANIVESFNLDEAKYLKCLNSPETRQLIDKSKEVAAAAGITSTPSTIIIDTQTGAQTVIGGAQDQTVLMDAIEKLNEQGSTLAHK